MSIQFTPFYLEHQLAKEPGLDSLFWLSAISYDFNMDDCLDGYREGVKLLPISLEKWGLVIKHKTISLTSADPIQAKYEARVEGETPRKSCFVPREVGSLDDAKYAFVVLYHRDVLAEDADFIDEEWGVVAHLSSMEPTPEPMHPDTFLANHYALQGGTSTLMDAEEFERTLGHSVHYWKDKVLAHVIYPDNI